VLAGGGDWVTAKGDATFELDLRVTLETDDGALIHMTFTGVRDDANLSLPEIPSARRKVLRLCVVRVADTDSRTRTARDAILVYNGGTA
jgi:hypothetical protein